MQADGAGVNGDTENTGVEVGAAGGRHGGLADGYGVDAVPPIEHAGTSSLLPHPPESALPWGRREKCAYPGGFPGTRHGMQRGRGGRRFPRESNVGEGDGGTKWRYFLTKECSDGIGKQWDWEEEI
jgi:hypothetical protein